MIFDVLALGSLSIKARRAWYKVHGLALISYEKTAGTVGRKVRKEIG